MEINRLTFPTPERYPSANRDNNLSLGDNIGTNK